MKTVKTLLIALVNATLILVALCLFLGLQLFFSAERAAASFSRGIADLAPLRQQATDATEAVLSLRAELAALGSAPGALSTAAQENLSTRVDALNATVTDFQTQLAALDAVPEQVATVAIDRIADRAAGLINHYRSCGPAD